MIAFFRKLTSSVFIPVTWTLLTIILLCLPGSAFPSKGLFDLDIPHLDKVIHVILFGGVTLFWCLYFLHKNSSHKGWRFIVLTVALSAIALGICMEYVQFNYIPNRAFDAGDIVANSLSAITFGMFFYFKRP
jgi:hypothetical protein